MSRLDAATPVPVRIGDCLCANAPHDGLEGHDDGDLVFLAPQLSLDGGLAAQGALVAYSDDPLRVERELGRAYLSTQIVGWNFLDDDGKPIPLNWENIEKALSWGTGGRLVAEKADELYSATMLTPLLDRLSKLSSNGQMVRSTSRPSRSRVGTAKRRASSSRARAAGRK
jgi:hypothetical protein